MQTGRLKITLADLVTSGNAVCGFLAIAFAALAGVGEHDGSRLSDTDLAVVGGLIIAGALLDSADGAVARWRGGGALGEHLELMSDITTFGLAPSIFFAVDAASYRHPWGGLALLVATLYTVAVLLRLARYASTPGEEPGLTGLPAAPAAMAAVSIIVLHLPPPLALAAMTSLSVLMVASFPFPRIVAKTAPLMGAWWALGGAAAFGLIPVWPVAVFTLTAIFALLLLIPLHRWSTARGGEQHRAT
ncbi:MAG: CDP-alcohol phosphatidyltransferase family protein [Gaiellaceae bacterium]